METSEVLQSALELAHFGLAELDTEGCFVAVNSEYLAMLGMDEEELLGRHWHITVHPDDHGRVKEAYRLARTSGRGYVEIRAPRQDGTIVYQALTVTGSRGIGGVFTGYQCLRHDISNYKRDREILLLAVESAPSGLLLLDADGRIRSANGAVETLFGYTRDELIGRGVETLLPYRAVESIGGSPGAAISGAAISGGDQSGVRKDGVEIPLQVSLNRIETDLGELTLCTIIDIAERIRNQEQLQLAKQAAEAANRAKSDFLARMSHEIRTPMNLIMGMNALLLESSLDEKQREHVEISYRNVRRLLRLINGILDLSKVEAGQVTLVAAPFDLREAVEECAATTASAIERKGLQFEWSIDADLWRYWSGDAERLQQVLLNLIGNAIKFTDRGKIGVRVRTERGEEGQRGLRFEVTDTGCGVPRDKTAMIFEAFQQAEGAMDRPYEGTGLGLAIAKTLVEMMGGRIWVEETSMSGSKFAFTAFLPLATEREVRAKDTKAASAEAAATVEAGTRVLLVEDNPENVVLMRAYLDNLALSLDFAVNGLEALEARKRTDYDLVLMDVQMPVMDGYTATREIRAWEQIHSAPRVPIIALTAHALTGAAAESLEAGCDEHITKPLGRSDVVEAVAKFAKRAAPPRETIPESILALRPPYLGRRLAELETMRRALVTGDFATIQTIGHNCKGTGVGYGFPEISRLGAAVETAAKSRRADEVERSIRLLERCVAAASAKSGVENNQG